ncbi:single-stranded-DNA-specific exonuclease C-terminal domain-containing protein, partial [Staphylococcus aureus]|nr:single-stranded-DNA-specific exonuclease C-terminal domain-containing protein [Staphylococcus aureus]
GMPTPTQFKNCYKALITKKETNLEQEGMLLCQFLDVKPNILKFMLKVFFELGFVTEENGIIKIKDNPNKQNIETSRVYQLRQS